MPAGHAGNPDGGLSALNLGGGTAVADVHGPLQPECSPEGASNLSSSWFHLIE
jgi:hypothetical protein